MCLSTFNSIHSFHNYLLFLIYVYFSQLTSPTNTIHIYSSLLIIIIFTDSYPHFTPFTFHSQLSNKSNHHSSFTLNFFTAPSSSPLSKFQFHSLSLSRLPPPLLFEFCMASDGETLVSFPHLVFTFYSLIKTNLF